MIKLKEVLVKVLEGRCERLDNESDEDFITRCGNQGWDNNGGVGINLTPHMSTTMQKKLVIPMKETIKKIGNKYVVYPKNGGKRLGTHSTLSSAKKQLSAIEINKK